MEAKSRGTGEFCLVGVREPVSPGFLKERTGYLNLKRLSRGSAGECQPDKRRRSDRKSTLLTADVKTDSGKAHQ